MLSHKGKKKGRERSQSGLAIALSNQLRNIYNVCHQNDKLLALYIKALSLTVIVPYFSPKTNLGTIYQALTRALQCCQGKPRIILGDEFNCRLDSTERAISLYCFLN